MPRRLAALDETRVKVNGLGYWVYAAVDVDKRGNCPWGSSHPGMHWPLSSS
jgi:hypothetical protein